VLELLSNIHPLLLTGIFHGVEFSKIVKVSSILAAKSIHCPAGMQVVWQGDYGDSMYVVVEGLFSCRVTAHSAHNVFHIFFNICHINNKKMYVTSTTKITMHISSLISCHSLKQQQQQQQL